MRKSSGQSSDAVGINILFPSLLFTALWLVFLGVHAHADVVTLSASKDNTLYETTDGSLSNGAGPGIFVGNNNAGKARRGLIAFDLSSIPAGSTINSATLTLNMSQTNPNTGAQTITLHRVLVDWGKGTSRSTNQGGGGGGPPLVTTLPGYTRSSTPTPGTRQVATLTIAQAHRKASRDWVAMTGRLPC